MQVYVQVKAAGGRPAYEGLELLASEGVEAVEWSLRYPTFAQESDAAEVRMFGQALHKAGLRLHSLHAPFAARVDISSLDAGVRSETLAACRRVLSIAGELGARCVVIHPGQAPRGTRMPERIGRAAETLGILAPLARDAGVLLAVENLPPEYPGSNAEEVLAIVQAAGAPEVRGCFDAGHAHLAGGVEGLARALLPYAATMHLHDNDAGRDQHLWPGLGTIPWAEFARAYRESGCAAPAVLECAPPPAWPLRAALENLRRRLAGAYQVC